MSQDTSTQANVSPIKRALRAVEDMQAKLEALTYAQREPIAIIGMGCRFPGGANDPDAFWQQLEHGVDSIGPVPRDRWDADAYYDADPDAPGKIYTREGGFLSQINSFDAPFFGISAREATSLDPQQRLLLEVSWEALESANQASDRVFNSTTGVFIGICSNEYNKMLWEAGGAASVDAFCATGNALSLAAGRLSYALGLKGPSLAVDTACSSSLVALHLACQHLRSGECDLAISGGVHLLLAPESSVAFARTRMLDPSGRCKTFDASASGYVRGEGCGAVVLKRLSDAQQDGDNILAVVQGSAVNHNGRSSSLVAPNGPAQQEVIRKALEMAQAEPSQIGFVEVQGTGTAVGQSLEIGALTTVFGKGRSANAPLYVGSVKTNFGHLEGASGIASLIKVILSLQHQTIPPHLHFQDPNPHIDWQGLSVKVPTQPSPWSSPDGRPRLAGINCFGFSGTNAHIILAEPPGPSTPASTSAPEFERPLHLLTLSAKNLTSLQNLVAKFQQYLVDHPSADLADICFSANTGRSHFRYRLAIAAASTLELSQQLTAIAQQQTPAMVWSGEVTSAPNIAFLFPGTGGNVNMGRKLYDTQPIFRTVLNRCQDLLKADLPTPLLEVLYPAVSKAPIDYAPLDITEPSGRAALFAIEYGLYQLWKSWGVEPSLLIGHGVGELVSACVAGVFDLETGLKLSIGTIQPPSSLTPPRYPLWAIAAGQAVTDTVTQASYWQSLDLNQPLAPEALTSLPQPTPSIALLMGEGEAIATLGDDSTHPIPLLASLTPDSDWSPLLSSLAKLYTLGTPLDWVGFDQPYSRQSLTLPTYSWRRQRYWFEAQSLHQPPQLDGVLPTTEQDSSLLLQQLEATGELSEAELAVVPKLLSLLSQQNLKTPLKTTLETTLETTIETTTEAEPVDLKNLTAEDIKTWLVNRIAQELGVDSIEINPSAPFDSYGLDSVLAIGIASAGKQYLGVEVTPLMLVHHPTIETLSNHLIAEFEESGTEVFEL